ncbi:twin-arginine translocase TatA/TatE family subunit [Mucilaginibacter mali]|uniref:Sec-independent protein translocase protein TatA n=1 Tax=Mucilaginibacter mali TaxID=2740462 RepID=A0A7D4Q5B3_9SPHI|nr:twin-arginine translocase TatA/TatE family subunit [Mucilaginibacter mali]QKJ31627.1 twin-arginine translocase TatA/TatE family subunit [Mucilaginibacter mali]
MFSSVLLFLNIGTPELILIMFVALLLFGGEKLPGIARGLGKGIRDFKDASEGVKREINNQINSYEEKKTTQPEEEVAHHDEEVHHDEAQVAHHEPAADETKPLIDTTPVAGTTPVGGYQTAEHTEEPKSGSGINLTKADEPVKTDH